MSKQVIPIPVRNHWIVSVSAAGRSARRGVAFGEVSACGRKFAGDHGAYWEYMLYEPGQSKSTLTCSFAWNLGA